MGPQNSSGTIGCTCVSASRKSFLNSLTDCSVRVVLGVVRHPASPTVERRFYTVPASAGEQALLHPASQEERSRSSSRESSRTSGCERLPHDGRHLRRERRRRGLDLVPVRHALDQARPFRSVRVVPAAAALQRVDHLAAAHRRHEQHSLQPAVPVHLAFVPPLEMLLAVVVDIEELEGAPVDAERVGREIVEDDDVRPSASCDREQPLDLCAELRDLAVHEQPRVEAVPAEPVLPRARAGSSAQALPKSGSSSCSRKRIRKWYEGSIPSGLRTSAMKRASGLKRRIRSRVSGR